MQGIYTANSFRLIQSCVFNSSPYEIPIVNNKDYSIIITGVLNVAGDMEIRFPTDGSGGSDASYRIIRDSYYIVSGNSVFKKDASFGAAIRLYSNSSKYVYWNILLHSVPNDTKLKYIKTIGNGKITSSSSSNNQNYNCDGLLFHASNDISVCEISTNQTFTGNLKVYEVI